MYVINLSVMFAYMDGKVGRIVVVSSAEEHPF